MNPCQVFIIIPAYNEEKTIYRVVEEVLSFWSGAKRSDRISEILSSPFGLLQDDNLQGQVIVIDDGSSDQTLNEAQKAGAIVIRHLINRGQGAALQTGTDYALKHSADIIVHFDADGQHTTTDIEYLVKPILSGEAEVVLGSRFQNSKLKTQNSKLRNIKFLKLPVTGYQLLVTKSISLTRRILLLGSLIINSITTGLILSDVHNGLRALSRYAAQKINITQDRMAHNTEYLQEIKNLGLTYQEVPVNVKYHQNDKKSQGVFEGIKILKELVMGKIIR